MAILVCTIPGRSSRRLAGWLWQPALTPDGARATHPHRAVRGDLGDRRRRHALLAQFGAAHDQDETRRLEQSTTVGPTALVSLALDSDSTDDEARILGHDQKALLETLKEALDGIASRSPNDAQAARSFIVDVATKVAESSKEGGFLGIGGTRVSDSEKTAIDLIRTAIGARAAGAGT